LFISDKSSPILSRTETNQKDPDSCSLPKGYIGKVKLLYDCNTLSLDLLPIPAPNGRSFSTHPLAKKKRKITMIFASH
jgi:hypothetical protein